MSVGPIPSSAATSHGIGINAPRENDNAEHQVGNPGTSAPTTIAGVSENNAAESQIAQVSSPSDSTQGKGSSPSNTSTSGGPISLSMGGGVGLKGGEKI